VLPPTETVNEAPEFTPDSPLLSANFPLARPRVLPPTEAVNEAPEFTRDSPQNNDNTE
jgi:hypothetical protein